jgi:hypothetical protein
MATVDKLVEQAIRVSGLSSNEILEIPLDQASAIYQEAKANFVSGNPRVWWLQLKQKPRSVGTDNSPEFNFLRDSWPVGENSCYFIPENETGIPRVFDATLSGIIGVLRNSSFIEYYLVGKLFHWLMIENDHNELLIVERSDGPECF